MHSNILFLFLIIFSVVDIHAMDLDDDIYDDTIIEMQKIEPLTRDERRSNAIKDKNDEIRRQIDKGICNKKWGVLRSFIGNGLMTGLNIYLNVKYNPGYGSRDSSTIWISLLNIATILGNFRNAFNIRRCVLVIPSQKFLKWANAISGAAYAAGFFLSGPLVNGFRQSLTYTIVLGANSLIGFLNYQDLKDTENLNKELKEGELIIARKIKLLKELRKKIKKSKSHKRKKRNFSSQNLIDNQDHDFPEKII